MPAFYDAVVRAARSLTPLRAQRGSLASSSDVGDIRADRWLAAFQRAEQAQAGPPLCPSGRAERDGSQRS